MKFKKYSEIENSYRIGYMEKIEKHGYDFDTLKCGVTEKIHGCLDEDTKITTKEFGEVPISFVVDNKIKCNVLSYQVDSNEAVWDKITKHSKQKNNNDWYKITLDNGKTIKLTKNHKIWDNKKKKYITVKDLLLCYKDVDIVYFE